MKAIFKDILTQIKPEIFDDPDCDLVEDGVLDSLDVMTIISHCEEAFGIELDPDDVIPENFASVEAIWTIIQKGLEEKNAN